MLARRLHVASGVIAGRIEQHHIQAGPSGADHIHFVDVADVQRTFGCDAQRLECGLKNPRVGLFEADQPRIHDHLEVGSNPRRIQSLFNSSVTVGDDAEPETGLSHAERAPPACSGCMALQRWRSSCRRSSVSRTNPSCSRGTPARRKRLSR